MAGGGVSKVVLRCEDAKETERLDLSSCLLVSVPDAIFFLLKNIALHSCDLSSNFLKRIPSKLCIKFSHLTELKLRGNKLISLPDEMTEMTMLQSLDISHNNFSELPKAVYELATLKFLNAESNIITALDVDQLVSMVNLVEVNLQDNPLPPPTHHQLTAVTKPTVLLSDLQEEEQNYEDVD